MGLLDEFKAGNFSLYGQWCGLISIVTLIVFGIIPLHVAWSVIGWIIAFILVFVEIPLCMKCCPTSEKFDRFVSKTQNSYFRAGLYFVFAVIMWIAVGAGGRTVQCVSALLLTFATIAYGIAGARDQSPASSAITGGTGVSSIV
ncbi:Golgi apparatus membrane protein tvp18 [Entomortierella beljakovae]|nr:Golgi apparatus membrane protein tvp18 [Entomortierella beljakovae]